MLSRIGLCAGGVSLAILSGCCSIPERVERLEKENVEIRQELAALKSDDDMISLNDLFEVYWDGNYNRLNPVLVNRYLEKVVLPENPSPKQVDAYLAKLYRLRRCNMDSSMNDQLSAKIIEVGAGNLEKLLPYLDFNAFSQAFTALGGAADKALLKRVIVQKQNNSQIANLFTGVADASDSDFILEMLPRVPALIDAVPRLGLQKKALPLLKKQLMDSERGRFNYSRRWLEVALGAMSPAEQAEFMEAYWGKFKRSMAGRGNDWEQREVAAQLAPLGCVAAFQFMVDAALRQDMNNYLSRAMALTPCSSLEEFATWYKTNRDSLAFDAGKGFYLPAGGKSGEKPAPKAE